MAKYTKVQFISWEIYSGPLEAVDGAETAATGYQGISKSVSGLDFLDIESQMEDIAARVNFTEAAIDSCFTQAGGNSDPSTLKIFMGPEFLYRGAGGAYIDDLLWGWNAPPKYHSSVAQNYPGLFKLLKKLVINPKYKDWLFIFGTAVSAAFDETDDTLPFTAKNVAYIVRGGAGHGAGEIRHKGISSVSIKHYKSLIDFIKFKKKDSDDPFLDLLDGMSNVSDHVRYTNNIHLYPKVEDTIFEFDDVLDGDGNKIRFGIEICLDHLCSPKLGFHEKHVVDDTDTRLKDHGRIRAILESAPPPERVRIQLVPSGGMSLVNDSIWLQQGVNAYAFNCDGLSGFGFYYQNGAHTQLLHQNKDNDTDYNMRDYGDIEYYIKVPDIVDGFDSRELWSDGHSVSGAGYVRILPKRPL